MSHVPILSRARLAECANLPPLSGHCVGGDPGGHTSRRQYASIPRVAGGAREGDGVADVGEAGDVGEGATGRSRGEAEAGVRHRAVAAQIAVPGVVLPVDGALGHAAVQYVEPLLALAAADDLADPGRQHVHRGDRSAVVVHPHVERLDVLPVIHHDHRLLGVLLVR